MKHWHDFLDSLGTDGGRIFCLFVLLVIGVVIHKISGAESVLTGAFGALLLALKTTGTNKQQQDSGEQPK